MNATLPEQRRALVKRGPTGARAGQISLIDVLERLLQGGVTIHGQIMLTVADIDLVEVDLRLLVAGVEAVSGVRALADVAAEVDP